MLAPVVDPLLQVIRMAVAVMNIKHILIIINNTANSVSVAILILLEGSTSAFFFILERVSSLYAYLVLLCAYPLRVIFLLCASD